MFVLPVIGAIQAMSVPSFPSYGGSLGGYNPHALNQYDFIAAQASMQRQISTCLSPPIINAPVDTTPAEFKWLRNRVKEILWQG